MKFFFTLFLGGILSLVGVFAYHHFSSDDRAVHHAVEQTTRSASTLPRSDLAPDKNELYNHNLSVVGKWNALGLEMIAGQQLSPPQASRFLAILHIAMYEALNSIDRTYEPYDAYLDIVEDAVYDKEIVVASAAQFVVDHFFPDFYLLTAQEVPSVSQEDAISQTLGQLSAQRIIALRAADGAHDEVSYDIKDEVGSWRATPPYFETPLLPHWGSVQPFSEQSSDVYPKPPHDITTAIYAQEFDEVWQMGGVTSTLRTQEQSEIAKFWADGKGTYTPPGHWNVIMHQVVLEDGIASLEEEARCFALLNIAMADAGIQTWKAKFDYEYWRPIDAIRMASDDGNDVTSPSQEWFNYIETPNFPEYPSGHSAFSGAGSMVLTRILGEEQAFETYSLGLPGVKRSFDSFAEAADEAGMSRIYGGIHFQKANTEGLRVGREIGQYVATTLLQAR